MHYLILCSDADVCRPALFHRLPLFPQVDAQVLQGLGQQAHYCFGYRVNLRSLGWRNFKVLECCFRHQDVEPIEENVNESGQVVVLQHEFRVGPMAGTSQGPKRQIAALGYSCSELQVQIQFQTLRNETLETLGSWKLQSQVRKSTCLNSEQIIYSS